MELDSYTKNFFRAMDDHEFLDCFSYARESWFTLERPKTELVSFGGCYTSAQIALRKEGLETTPQNKRTVSRISLNSSPPTDRSRPVPRPISPPSGHRRRIRSFSSSEYSSSSEEGIEKSKDVSLVRKKARVVLHANHTSAFRGVSCCGKDRKYQARIRDGSKVHYLGRFDNEFDAAIKYDEAARSHKGDSAIPNFMPMTAQECQALRAHYFENGNQILSDFHKFLFQGTLERLEMKRAKKAAITST
jgi:hypothetical protein